MKGRKFSFEYAMVQRVDLSRRLVHLCEDCLVCHQQLECPIEDFDLSMEDIKGHRGSVLHYDYLILALGGTPNFFGIEGAQEYALPINGLEDAERIKKHILHAFAIAGKVRDAEKRKQILSFSVVGAGPTGLEFASELHDWIYGALKSEFTEIRPEEVKICLIEAGRDILPTSPRQVRLTAKNHIDKKRITLFTEAPVVRVGKNFLETKKGLMHTFTVIWAAGIKGHDLFKEAGLSVDSFERVVVGPYLSALGYDNVFAIGDCSSYKPPGAVLPLPQTGQVAVQEAHYMAKSLSTMLEGKPAEPFRYRELGSAISTGQYHGLVNLLGFLQLQGFTGWMAWKFTYLKHLISIRLSLRSLLEWLFDLTYDREATRHKF
jgi:NADH dehydrogenase